MTDRKAGTEEEDETEERLPSGEIRIKPAGEARVIPREAPVEPPNDKHIHRRRPLPLVREGPDHSDEDQ